MVGFPKCFPCCHCFRPDTPPTCRNPRVWGQTCLPRNGTIVMVGEAQGRGAPMAQEGKEESEVPVLAGRLLTLISASWVSDACRVAAALRLADLLAAGPRTSAELAEVTGTHAPSLHRLLRALAALDVCAEGEDGCF